MKPDRSFGAGHFSQYNSSYLRALKLGVFLGAVPVIIASCAPGLGYSDDPADERAVLSSLQPYFNPSNEAKYAALTGAERQSFRDTIVTNRMRAYNIKFGQFEKRLWGDSNLVSAGGDLIILILGGLGATTGSAATKSALAAASAGIVGAQGAINKDLYYQRTLPALLAQMEANRDTIEATILKGLQQPDATYSLYRADLDLDALQRASGIPEAIGQITGQASDNKIAAQASLQNVEFANTSSAAKIRAWVYTNGKLNAAHFARLQKWLDAQPEAVASPNGIPVATLIQGNDANNILEPIRQRALKDPALGIPN